MAKKTRLEMEYRRSDRPRDIPRDSLSRAELNKRDRGESPATRGNLDVTINVVLRGIEEITEQTAINPMKNKVSEQIKLHRSYVRNSSMATAIAVTIIAAVTLAVSGLAEVQPIRQNVPSSNGSFGPIKANKPLCVSWTVFSSLCKNETNWTIVW
jgi:hypothetical protein